MTPGRARLPSSGQESAALEASGMFGACNQLTLRHLELRRRKLATAPSVVPQLTQFWRSDEGPPHGRNVGKSAATTSSGEQKAWQERLGVSKHFGKAVSRSAERVPAS